MQRIRSGRRSRFNKPYLLELTPNATITALARQTQLTDVLQRNCRTAWLAQRCAVEAISALRGRNVSHTAKIEKAARKRLHLRLPAC